VIEKDCSKPHVLRMLFNDARVEVMFLKKYLMLLTTSMSKPI
jgi:hypothetical protein